MRWVVFWALSGLLAFGIALSVAFSPEASAGPCEYRSERHQLEHGGFTADNAWHLSRGELPTCQAEASSSSSKASEDKKSRYCRKRWFC